MRLLQALQARHPTAHFLSAAPVQGGKQYAMWGKLYGVQTVCNRTCIVRSCSGLQERHSHSAPEAAQPKALQPRFRVMQPETFTHFRRVFAVTLATAREQRALEQRSTGAEHLGTNVARKKRV